MTAGAIAAAFRHSVGWLAISLVMASIQVNLPSRPLGQQD
jgi:hypothetical protein